MTYPRGLYDLLPTEAVVRALDASRDHAETQPLVAEDASDRLLDVLREQLRRILDDSSADTDAYRACGPVHIASPDDVTGDRPMNIEWTLEVLFPARLFAEFSVLRGQA